MNDKKIIIKGGEIMSKCPYCKNITPLEMMEEYIQGNYYTIRVNKDDGNLNWEECGDGYIQKNRYKEWDGDNKINIICGNCGKRRKDITFEQIEKIIGRKV